MIVTKVYPDAHEQDFIDFMFSEEGKAIVGQKQYPLKETGKVQHGKGRESR